jgi:hypothetical protein
LRRGTVRAAMTDLLVRFASIVPRFGALLLAVGLAGCGANAGGSPAPPGGALSHPAGATDLILRYEQGGGFVAPGFLATEGPTFSLYGDGTAIFRNPRDANPVPDSTASPIIRGVPYQVAHLSEAQVQTLLAFALDPGGLRTADVHYERPIADAPTTVFTIDAGGIKKAVSINGLGIDAASGKDAQILTKLTELATKLQGYGSEVSNEQPWSPDRYRGLLGGDAFNSPMPWPWPNIKPTDFVQPTGPTIIRFPARTMTPAEVARLAITGVEGGLQGVSLLAPDGKVYSFRLRPLLPDEAL